MAISKSLLLDDCPSVITESKIDRERVVEFVCRWGSSASITLLDSTCLIYSSPEIQGIIGYRIKSGCAVVYGDPLSAPEDRSLLTRSFHQFCKTQGLHIIYLTASENFGRWAINDEVCHSMIEIGEELSLDPSNNLRSRMKKRGLRNKMNLALRAGIEVTEYLGNDEHLEKQIEQVGESWLNARKGPQIYLAEVQVFAERKGKRWFYAKHGEKIVGVLMLQQLDTFQGWLVQFLMTTPDAPVGTSEGLVVSTLQGLQNEGCHYMSFGVAQSEDLGEIIGFHKKMHWLLRGIFSCAKQVFHLDRRRRYWRKFSPQKEPSYLLFSEPGIGIKELRGLMGALNVSLWSFH